MLWGSSRQLLAIDTAISYEANADYLAAAEYQAAADYLAAAGYEIAISYEAAADYNAAPDFQAAAEYLLTAVRHEANDSLVTIAIQQTILSQLLDSRQLTWEALSHKKPPYKRQVPVGR